MSPRPSSYNAIVEAAEAVVIESGAAHMTLEAVASRAGVSKGGLLHHFPSKDALLQAMIERLIQAREDSRIKVLTELGDDRARELKAYIISGFRRDVKKDRVGAPILAALAHNPKLAEPVREVVRQRYGRFGIKGRNFAKSVILGLAADGLLLAEVLSVSPFSAEERDMIIDELLTRADEGMGD